MSKIYQNTTKASIGDWEFENNTTECFITLRLKNADDRNLTHLIHMEYYQFQQLQELLDIVNQKSI